jgi:hypothetical protein
MAKADDKTPELQAPDAPAPAAAPAAEPLADIAVSLKRKLKNLTVQEGYKAYQTTQKHTYPIDIQIHNELILGQWSREDGYVEFLVPLHLVEGFEKHYHFVSGNIAAAE